MLQRFLSGMMRSGALTARVFLLCFLIVQPAYSGQMTKEPLAEPPATSVTQSQQRAAQLLTPQAFKRLPPEVRLHFARHGVSPESIKALPPDMLESLPVEVRESFLRTSPPPAGKLPELPPEVRQQIVSVSEEDKTGEQGKSGSDPHLPSRVEKLYRDSYDSILAENLRQFGYDLFSSSVPKASRFAVPSNDYILGPGDWLRIRVWGSNVDDEFVGPIDRNGSINIPKIGIVPVAGVKFGKIEHIIRREAEKYIQGINISVSLEELRSVEVYVVGAVNKPGLHMAPAFSTVLDALLASEGVLKTGSLRKVRLYRNGDPPREVDLYDLLLKGSRTDDVILANRDVVFVPRLTATAAVAGAVKEEGIFELAEARTLGELLTMAGGPLPHAFTGRIHLRRYQGHQEFVIKDIDTRHNEQWKDVAVQDGDLLELQAVAGITAAVTLEGHVWRTDAHNFTPGLTLQQVLSSRELFRPGAVMDFALLHRYDPESTRYTVQRIPLEQVLRGSFNQELRPHDRIEILSREQLGIKEEIRVAGAVWNPGVFSYRPALTVVDAIALAGGVKFGARVQQVEVSRQQVEEERVTTRHFLVDIARQADFPLQPFDYLMVPQVKDHATIKTVTIGGEVRFPGEYRIADGERLSDLIARVGGFLPEAYYFGAKYTTLASKEIQRKSLDNLVKELEIRVKSTMSQQVQTSVGKDEVEAVKASREAVGGLIEKLKAIEPEGRVSIVLTDLESFKGSVYDFELSDGDVLHIPRRPFFVVTVGSVYSPSSYLYEPNRTVGYYLDKSGGPTKNADDKYIYVLRANGEVVSAAQRGLFSFSLGINSYKLMPGDTVVVPEDLERVPYLRLVKDVADIVFKIATTAGIAIAAL